MGEVPKGRQRKHAASSWNKKEIPDFFFSILPMVWESPGKIAPDPLWKGNGNKDKMTQESVFYTWHQPPKNSWGKERFVFYVSRIFPADQ